jgi:hypothetical protein
MNMLGWILGVGLPLLLAACLFTIWVLTERGALDESLNRDL